MPVTYRRRYRPGGMDGSRVILPPEAVAPLQVFVNGVEQVEGADFEMSAGELRFARELMPPRPDTTRSVVRGFFFGRYAPEDVVDVSWHAGGRAHVRSGLRIEVR
jgi:hypothetical protein